MSHSLNNLAVLLREEGDYGGAEPLYREALATERRLVGSAGAGRADEAEPPARKAVAIRRDQLPAGNPDRAESESVLGACLVKLHRHEEAEPLLLEASGILQANEPGRLRTRRAIQWVLALYEDWGKPEKAAEWRSKAEAQPGESRDLELVPAKRVSSLSVVLPGHIPAFVGARRLHDELSSGQLEPGAMNASVCVGLFEPGQPPGAGEPVPYAVVDLAILAARQRSAPECRRARPRSGPLLLHLSERLLRDRDGGVGRRTTTDNRP